MFWLFPENITLVQCRFFSHQVVTLVTSILNTFAQLDDDMLKTAEEETGSVSQFVSSFENILLKIEVTEETPFTVNEESVAVQVCIPTVLWNSRNLKNFFLFSFI